MIAILINIPILFRFENNQNTSREIVLIAVMTAMTVIGRLIFAPIPAFKPVTAMVIVTALAFGSEAGFLTGAMSAFVSNMFFGQGPWTPIQMLVWGLLGFVAGLFEVKNKKINWFVVAVLGVVGGVAFSLLMDMWTVFTYGGFNFKMYASLIVSSLPFMIVYVISNLVFLILLTKPFLKKLKRVKMKYGVFDLERQQNYAT